MELSTALSKRHSNWWVLLFAVVLSFVFFGNGIAGDFVLDDKIAIIGNPLVDDIGRFGEIFTSPYHFNQPRTGLYRPLTIASYAVNWTIFGNSPAWFHAVNILLHAAAVFLIFLICTWLGNRSIGIIASLLFLVLPIHVEAVTSIVGRAELLAFLGMVGALAAVIKKRYILASTVFFLGLLGKETAVAFLPLWLFWELMWQKTKWQIAFKHALFFIPPLAAYGIVRFIALSKAYFFANDANMIYNPIKFAPFFDGLWTSFDVLGRYIVTTFVPLSLTSDYSFHQIPIISHPFASWYAVLGLIVCGTMIVLAWRQSRSIAGLGAVIFLASFFVVSNFVFKIGTIMGERLFYIPSLGLLLVVAWGVSWMALRIRRKYLLPFLLVVASLTYGIRTIYANNVWLDEYRLFEHAYRQSPKSAPAIANKAYLDLIDGRLDEAKFHIDQALELAPDHAPILNLGGQIYKKLGNAGQAEAFWKRAIDVRQDYLRAYLSLGILYYESGYFKSGEYILERAIAIYPRWNEVLFLALNKIALGKYDEAIALITSHFGDHPPQTQLQFALGAAHLKKGDRASAITYLAPIKNPDMTLDEFLISVARGVIYDIDIE